MPSRLSHLMTLTMSVTCISRSTSRLMRCERSPRPVRVGVNTLWPRRSSRSETRRQHQPPCEAPCTSTKVLGRGVVDDEQRHLDPPDRVLHGRFAGVDIAIAEEGLRRGDDDAVFAIGQELDLVALAFRHQLAAFGAEFLVELGAEQRVARDLRD